MKPKNNKKLLEDEWVIQLVNAAESAVNGYEKYLLDEINYRELAKIMADLRDLLPEGCKENSKKNKDNS